MLWENTTNETVLQAARDEIWQSWRRACAENADHPRAKELFDRKKLPAFHDPFAGGGALPLEAQRLGLESYASDLNPVAVLINKAMIEIPPKFAGKPPVNPEARKEKTLDRPGVEGRAGPGRGRALLRPVDARRGREAHRPPLPEDRGHRRDGEGAAGPEAVRRPEAHRDRLALGAHGEEPEPGLRAGGRAARLDLHALHQGGQGGVRRAGDRERRLPLHGEGGEAEGCGGGEERHQAVARRELPVPDVGHADRGRLHQGRGQGRAHGRAADGDRRRGRSRARLSRADAGAWRRSALKAKPDVEAGGRRCPSNPRWYLGRRSTE